MFDIDLGQWNTVPIFLSTARLSFDFKHPVEIVEPREVFEKFRPRSCTTCHDLTPKKGKARRGAVVGQHLPIQQSKIIWDININ